MYTLYIDTHYMELVLALFKDGVIKDKIVRKDGRHSEYVVNSLKELLQNNNVDISSINEVIVINGPGSFTGVRIGCVIAKIISYTKNIPLKALSYLQALALNYEHKVKVGISDRNGVFVGCFDECHNLIGDYYYINNKDVSNFNDIYIDGDVDLNKVYLYMKKEAMINPHLLKPIYVKRIEVENG